tara:strand:+ start:4939 stop:5301 length:363 start_codon:yes stop_codon:yes gene_type:complete
MRVIIESPYSGGHPDNIKYARRCLWDSILRDESPFASHLLYTQVLDDKISEQRQKGMKLALAWYEVAELCAVYMDRGMTEGMESGIKHAKSLGIPIEERMLNDGDTSKPSLGDSFKTDWG